MSFKIDTLPHMQIIKDLVPNLNNFFNQYKNIKPWLMTAQVSNREFIQIKTDRAKLYGTKFG